ncbi:RNA methyltransferase [Puteibacter caeruleilacunae]|nr:RNA methyltransferase [Puteibacter caeruleilacunae]
MEKFNLLAKTFAGLEEVLAKELKGIGAENIKIEKRAVSYKGDLRVLYRSNFELRTALKVLKSIDSFHLKNQHDLYNGIKRIQWDKYFTNKQTFSVSSTAFSDLFRNSMFVSLKSKDAIVDYFRSKTGSRPSVSTANPDIIIHVHISGPKCYVSLDSSGESLHKRGYRTAQNEAPLNETMAAGLILLSGWDPKTPFIDPMCGSGTFPIEAALIARNIPPGMFRESFAFEKWTDFDADLWEEIFESDYENDLEPQIFGSDILSRNIDIAKGNAKNAFISKWINFSQKDFKELQPPTSDHGMLIMNPPYGERLKPLFLNQLYEAIGERLKHRFNNNVAWILGYSKEHFNKIGLRPSRKIHLYNGSLPCQFRQYELYSGSKKLK